MRRGLTSAAGAALVLCLLVAPTALGDDLPNLGVEISDVLVGASGQGDHRVVVSCGGFEHVTCNVWAQWRTHDRKDGTRVVQSVPIKELNGSGFVLGRLERSPASSFRVVANVTSTHDANTTGRFALELGEPGHYEFSWLDEPRTGELRDYETR